MAAIEVTELLGDGIGPELAQSVHAVAEALPIELRFLPMDLSLENRRKQAARVYDETVESAARTKLLLKYPTATETESPNAVLRRRLNLSVIYRPAISIRGVSSNFKENVNVHIVRVATGGTYDDPGQRVGRDSAVSLRIVERGPCTEAARFAFELARKKNFTVTSSSKHTIQRVTDGLFEEVVRDVAKRYTDVKHQVELFDALLAKIILAPQHYQVVLVLNEYGDFLSDMASGLVGSLGTGASASFSFTPDCEIDVGFFDPAGGTAPDIAGQGKCNPTAVLLALGLLLDHIDRYDLGHALRMAMLDNIAEGISTRDLGGKLNRAEFTQSVIDRMIAQLP